MRTTRWGWILTLVVLLWSLPAGADPKTRIFAQNVEYLGPTEQVDNTPYVQAERFARTMGWSVTRLDAALDIAPNDDMPPMPATAKGLYISGKPFTGKTTVEDGDIYVSLPDLVSSLGGSIRSLPEYHTLKLDVPGMPTAQVAGSVHSLSDSLKGSNYTLVEYYATW